MAKAVYAGSFDPFTKGHLFVVKQAAKMFDEVYILVAKNPGKRRMIDVETMQILITDVLMEENLTNCYCDILPYSMTTADFAEMLGAEFLVRGIRNAEDYFYETSMAKTNKILNPNLQTIYVEAEENISSSTVKILKNFYKPYKHFLPNAIAYYMTQEEEADAADIDIG